MKPFDVMVEWMEWDLGATRANLLFALKNSPLFYHTWRSRRKTNREMDQVGAMRQKACGLTSSTRANRDSSKMRRL